MAAVHDPSMRFGKDVISTHSDNPEEAAYAAMLYEMYTSGSTVVTRRVVHMKCSNMWAHQYSLDVSNPDGLSITDAMQAARQKYNVCPKCGKSWKKLWVEP